MQARAAEPRAQLGRRRGVARRALVEELEEDHDLIPRVLGPRPFLPAERAQPSASSAQRRRGGAVAAAVGERLARLGQSTQALVVTHSPQVAAKGDIHMKIAKTATDSGVFSGTEALTPDARTEEIARMLAGEEITTEARAAALALLEG